MPSIPERKSMDEPLEFQRGRVSVTLLDVSCLMTLPSGVAV